MNKPTNTSSTSSTSSTTGTTGTTGALLSGIRVLDLSRTLAAPLACQMLADFGADVIKVERPGQGDESRAVGPTYLKDADGKATREGSMYLAANRNKRGMTLDISTPDGQDIVRKLAGISDVLVENYKPGGLAQYGLDYARLAAINPKLIYCSVSGFGHSGPYSKRAGYDPIFQAMAGWMSVNGPTGPVLMNSNPVDVIAGYNAVMGILAALRHRDQVSGKGQHIDVALLDVSIATYGHRMQDHLLTGRQPPRRANTGVVYPCADSQIVIAIGNETLWKRFCEVLGRPDLATDPRYAGHAARVAAGGELYPLLESLTRNFTVKELMGALEAAGIPHGPILDYAGVLSNEQVLSRGMVKHVDHPSNVRLGLVANPIRFSETPIESYRAPPLLGQHTHEILRTLLELSDAEIRALEQEKVI